jgi:hypothetical protein
MFFLAITHLEVQEDRHIFIFRALSILRAGRLLVVTSGTMVREVTNPAEGQTILHSLKRAGPMLIRVSAFVIFALVLFSIIGVQAFRGGFRRVCMYTGWSAVSELMALTTQIQTTLPIYSPLAKFAVDSSTQIYLRFLLST